MISDAREISVESIDCDICIVGGGAAGITLSNDLAGSRFKVVLLESGDEYPTPEALALNAGSKTGDPYPDLETARLRGLGGTTNHWEGSCNRFSALDFERRPWVPDSGWPIDLTILGPFYDRAHPLVELPSTSFDVDEWSRSLRRPLLAADRSLVESMVSMTSPPTRFGITYGPALSSASNVNVLLNATATGVVRDGPARIAGVVVSRDGKGTFTVTARRFVLALGGLENARFMLWTKLGNETDNVGRYFMEHPVLRASRWLPAAGADTRLYLPPGGPPPVAAGSDAHLNVHLCMNDQTLRANQLSNARVALVPLTQLEASEGIESLHMLREIMAGRRPSVGLADHMWNIVRDFDEILDGIARKTLNKKLFDSGDKLETIEMQWMIEQYPERTNRVTLGSDLDRYGVPKLNLHWKIGEREIDHLRKSINIMARGMGAAGLGKIENRLERNDFSWPPRHMGYGYHHMGTTRCSDDPKAGVVDRDMKVHGLENLYVAGSSVFPTGSYVPPTLTIVALALRLADHLKRV